MPEPRRRPTPEAPWQPPLTRWGHTWRLLLVLMLSGGVWFPVLQTGVLRPGLVALDAGLGVAALVLVWWRRDFPFAIAMVTAAFGVASVLAAGPATLAAVSMATRRRYGQILAVAAISLVASQVWEGRHPGFSDDPFWVALTINSALLIAILVFGMYVGSRRELLWTLRERALRAEAEQSLRVDQARATERQRIAREMHDVLGHRISLVSMHAGALAYRTDLDDQQVRESARVIQDNAHLAMSELRSVLGVLRGAEAEHAPDRPAPVLHDVPQLVEEAVVSGMRVELAQRLDAAAVPTGVGRTVYRVVQEGLTNVRKHAPFAEASVAVTGSPETGVLVRVSNPLPSGYRTTGRSTQLGGFGVVGLTERAELAGGRLRSRAEGGCFVLEVWLPWQS